jgi:hypothetical protein
MPTICAANCNRKITSSNLIGFGLLNVIRLPDWAALLAAVLVLDFAIYLEHVHVPCGSDAVAAARARVALIDAGDLKRRLEAGEPLQIIDGRGLDEFAGPFGHIA